MLCKTLKPVLIGYQLVSQGRLYMFSTERVQINVYLVRYLRRSVLGEYFFLAIFTQRNSWREGFWIFGRAPHLFLTGKIELIELACVAGAKRGGGGGREKGKREGSACSKSLCFCITPTNFLVIRLRLLSIKCRYTRHWEKHYTHGLKKFA